ncbi:spherulin-2A-like [Leptidea sinapis]|uniref:spherulin-2A-like n=1 Tax=Leptidea sinapis TaxID=189913 RepID=UPI002141E7B6|nr:spherulin-2A-like [Leptidea sinapis]
MLYLTLFCASLVIVRAKINIDIITDKTSEVTAQFSGYDISVISDSDINLFNLNRKQLKVAVKKHFKATPQNVYLKSPTPWNDLYKSNNWEQVSRILSIKSITVKEDKQKPTIVLSQDFENFSNSTVKVNTALSQSVENTITTSWITNKEWTVSQEISYDINIIFAKFAGSTGFSWTTTWGKSEEKSETTTIGATSAVETELKPGQSVSAVLSANRRSIRMEITYLATLRGNVAVHFNKPLNGHHFYGPSIISVMKNGEMETEITIVENINIGIFVDHSLKVYDKITGQPL